MKTMRAKRNLKNEGRKRNSKKLTEGIWNRTTVEPNVLENTQKQK